MILIWIVILSFSFIFVPKNKKKWYIIIYPNKKLDEQKLSQYKKFKTSAFSWSCLATKRWFRSVKIEDKEFIITDWVT